MTIDEMQSRLDALLIHLDAENATHTVEIECQWIEHHEWVVKVAAYDGDDGPTPGVEKLTITWLHFDGRSIADAVEKAWEFYGAPVICPECDGEGTFWWWGDAIPADADEAGIQTHHDGRRSFHRDCATCAGDRILIAAEPSGTDVVNGTSTITIAGVAYEIPAGYHLLTDEHYYRLNDLATLLSDLDRSPHGRHEGDVEGQTPGGVSLGNPNHPTGSVLGYGMDGKPIVMPPVGQRTQPDAWRSK